MKQTFLLFLAFVALVAHAVDAADAKLPIIPQPNSIISVDESRHLELKHGMGIYASNADARIAAEYLQHYCEQYLNLRLPIVEQQRKASIFIQGYDKEEPVTEGAYTMTINHDGVYIVANNQAPEGFFYGVCSLIQLLPSRAGYVPQLPYCAIEDCPAFHFRGMHLDVVRHYFPVAYIKKFIDWMALHKLNIFHWHLTDDQGWRLQLKSHPELTAKGGFRAGEIKGLFPGEYTERPLHAYYTQEEVKEIIDYAAKRYITVVPEIDIPGHCMAVLAAHPEFSTTPGEEKQAALTWGIYRRQNNVLAPTPEVFQFLTEVFDEVCTLFPSKYIHAGGDECAPQWWRDSEATQQFMKEHNLENSHALQTYFMHHVQRVINGHGKTMLGWSGGAEGMDPTGSILHHWHVWPKINQSRIDSTHQWINSGSRGYYFTSKEDSTQTDLTAGKMPVSVKDTYLFPHIPDSANADVAKNLMGIEGCIWTEYVPTTRKLEFQVFPRLAAMAEKAWIGEARDWNDFAHRLSILLNFYDLWGIRYNPVSEGSLIPVRE
ncbi:MAG: beta-N-acetylhexosaminidase [Sodaliphilus sp.]